MDWKGSETVVNEPIEEPDLSGYEVEITRTMIGNWQWRVTDPNGDRVENLDGMASFSRESAEKAALKAIEHDLRQPDTIDGNELRDRVRGVST